MNDEGLADVWTTLEPSVGPRRRIDARVSAWLDARDTSLAAEWLGLFRVEPVAAIGLVTVSAIAILAATPLGWFVRVLM
jgi:hypothetical protein